MNLNLFAVKPIVQTALDEDIGYGDLTTTATIPEGLRAKAVVKAKENGVLAGMPVFKLVYELLDSRVEVTAFLAEGSEFQNGDTIAEVVGPAQVLLTGERVALNFLQRLCGVATKTRRYADLIKYYDTHLVDTRKTTPGLRLLEKYAVRVGGGRNHRFNLSDAVLIKDNHIEIAGGLKSAVVTARQHLGHTVKIEVETSSLEQVKEALEAGVDIIMLDNMSLEQMSEAVELIDGRAVVEASGNINEENIVDVAKTGVDYISCGSLTHSYKSIDISMNVKYRES